MSLVLLGLLLPLGPQGLLGFVVASVLFYEVKLGGSPVSIKLGYWLEHLNVEWTFLFDSKTVSMMVPVIYVSILVQLYSMGYMAGDAYLPRFFSYLSLFSLMMMLLITGENLLVLFVGWEGVGIASYLLINFWFTRLAANFAAMKAFLMNRVGDYSLVLGLLLLLRVYSDLSLDSVLSLALYLDGDLLFVIIVFVVLGSIGMVYAMVSTYLYYITIYAITFLVQGVILALSPKLLLGGLVNLNLPLSLAWALSLFSLAGIPPLAGFYAKLLVLYSLLTLENGLLALLIIGFSAVSAANYLSLVKLAFFDLPEPTVVTCPAPVSYLISALLYFVVVAIL